MSEALIWALNHPHVDGNEKLMLIMLADKANPGFNWQAWPSQAWLAKRTGYSERSIIRYMKTLEDHGVISRRKRYNHKGERSTDAISFPDFDPNNPKQYANTPKSQSDGHVLTDTVPGPTDTESENPPKESPKPPSPKGDVPPHDGFSLSGEPNNPADQKRITRDWKPNKANMDLCRSYHMSEADIQDQVDGFIEYWTYKRTDKACMKSAVGWQRAFKNSINAAVSRGIIRVPKPWELEQRAAASNGKRDVSKMTPEEIRRRMHE